MDAQTDLLSKYASNGAVAITTLFMLWSRSQTDQNKVLFNSRQNISILSSDVVPLLLGLSWRVLTAVTLYVEMQRRANPFEENNNLVNSQKIHWLIWILRRLSGPAIACLRRRRNTRNVCKEKCFRQNGHSFPGTEHGHCTVKEI